MDTTKADKEAFDRLAGKVENYTISKDAFDEHVKSDEKQLGAINDEQHMQRGHIAKIFDKIDEVKDEMHKGKVDLLEAIHSIKARK